MCGAISDFSKKIILTKKIFYPGRIIRTVALCDKKKKKKRKEDVAFVIRSVTSLPSGRTFIAITAARREDGRCDAVYSINIVDVEQR